MKIKILIMLTVGLFYLGCWIKPAFAVVHTHQDKLFSMDIPKEWHWVDNLERVLVTYPDNKSVAIDIQLVPSRKIAESDIKKILKDSDDKMIKEGVLAHQGVVLSDKEINLGGAYARQLDFKSASPNPIHVTYISLFYKGFAYTITYGAEDEKMHSLMDDVVATLKFS